MCRNIKTLFNFDPPATEEEIRAASLHRNTVRCGMKYGATIIGSVPPLLAALSLVVNLPVANLYSKPSTDADVVTQAIYGASVVSLEHHDGWHKIRTPDDYTGWIPAAGRRCGRSWPTWSPRG